MSDWQLYYAVNPFRPYTSGSWFLVPDLWFLKTNPSILKLIGIIQRKGRFYSFKISGEVG